MQQFMEVDAKMETFSSNFGEKFNALTAQIQGIETRLVQLEKIWKIHTRDLQEDKSDIVNVKYKLYDMWDHYDGEINDAKENASELTTCLNTTTIKAIQAEKILEETKVTHEEVYSTMLVLVEGQKQSTQAIKDVQFSLSGKFNDLIGKTTGLNGKSSDLSKRVKIIDDRLANMEETVNFCLRLESI